MEAAKIKKLFIISTFPIIALLTLGIFPLIMSIFLLIDTEKFKNKDLALATGILGIVCFLAPFIMGFFLEPKTAINNTNTSENTEY